MENSTSNKQLNGSFSENLKEAMRIRGLNQKQLAEKIGVTPQSISYYCNGTRLPDVDILRSLANCLEVSADFLLGISPIQSKDLNVKGIHRMTGLSERAIQHLMSIILDETKSVQKKHPQYSDSEARSVLEKNDELWVARLASILICDGGTPSEYGNKGQQVRAWSRPISEILGDILLWHKRLGDFEFYELTGKIHSKDNSLNNEDYYFNLTADQIQNIHLLELNTALKELYIRLCKREDYE